MNRLLIFTIFVFYLSNTSCNSRKNMPINNKIENNVKLINCFSDDGILFPCIAKVNNIKINLDVIDDSDDSLLFTQYTDKFTYLNSVILNGYITSLDTFDVNFDGHIDVVVNQIIGSNGDNAPLVFLYDKRKNIFEENKHFEVGNIYIDARNKIIYELPYGSVHTEEIEKIAYKVENNEIFEIGRMYSKKSLNEIWKVNELIYNSSDTIKNIFYINSDSVYDFIEKWDIKQNRKPKQ